ncbi:MAG TPA: MarR family transcriptional regulator [Acidimicrobiales bacterium]|jgi:DNA-binding MarR family transcriptional regulator|nr:MarR family transcriptional regulator [Acidimicrobiales bacterium]
MKDTADGSEAGNDASDPRRGQVGLGGALRRAWIGYQRRLDEELAVAGFKDRGFPDGRVLRICSRSPEVTISQIGRQLGITRQGAGKIIASLRDRRYVTVDSSTTSGREKTVKLTPRAVNYLAAQRKAAREIEHQLRDEIGIEGFDSLIRFLDALGGDDQPRMSDFLGEVRDVLYSQG